MDEAEHRAAAARQATHQVMWHNPATGHGGPWRPLPEDQATELARRLSMRYPGIEHWAAPIAPALRNDAEETLAPDPARFP